MAMNFRDRKAYRADDQRDHSLLSNKDRRNLLESYLPKPPKPRVKWQDSPSQPKSRFGVRRFLRNQLHLFVFTVMHFVFSIYIRIRQAWHTVRYRVSSILFYHHRTPALIEKDVKGLGKKPSHLSVILKMEEHGRATDIEKLVNEASDIAAWCVCAGIPMLSVYEKTGILKRYMPQVQRTILQKFGAYFGHERPGLSLMAPHSETIESPAPGSLESSQDRHLKLLFISFEDGRESMVDLTKTLTEMSQRAKLSPSDIRIDLIDAELSEGIMPEPELLLLFGSHVELSGYPPWQIRLTEIFCLQDNHEVGYQVFLRGLRNFAHAQMRNGK